MYVLTITERTLMPLGMRDTNTYHVFCNSLFDVSEKIEGLALNYVYLVSLTITPFKE